MQAREYLESFAVQEAITQALGQIIQQRPSNPVKALGKILIEAEEKKEEAKMLGESTSRPPAPNIRNPAAARARVRHPPRDDCPPSLLSRQSRR